MKAKKVLQIQEEFPFNTDVEHFYFMKIGTTMSQYFPIYFVLRQTFYNGNSTQNTIWVASEPGNSTHVELEYKIKEGMITE